MKDTDHRRRARALVMYERAKAAWERADQKAREVLGPEAFKRRMYERRTAARIALEVAQKNLSEFDK